MQISDHLRIESADGNDDVYVISYTSSGQPRWARVLSGEQLQVIQDMQLTQTGLALTGYFQRNIGLDSISVEARAGFDGFLMTLDTADGGAKALQAFRNDGNFLLEGIIQSEDTLILGGSYQGDFPGNILPFSSDFDLFLFDPSIISTSLSYGRNETAPDFRIYPNPASNWFALQPACRDCRFRIFSPQGQLLRKGWFRQGDRIALQPSRLPVGLYRVQVLAPDGRTITLPLVINR